MSFSPWNIENFWRGLILVSWNTSVGLAWIKKTKVIGNDHIIGLIKCAASLPSLLLDCQRTSLLTSSDVDPDTWNNLAGTWCCTDISCSDVCLIQIEYIIISYRLKAPGLHSFVITVLSVSWVSDITNLTVIVSAVSLCFHCRWYFGKVSRNASEEWLLSTGYPKGSFLVRQGEASPGIYLTFTKFEVGMEVTIWLVCFKECWVNFLHWSWQITMKLGMLERSTSSVDVPVMKYVWGVGLVLNINGHVVYIFVYSDLILCKQPNCTMISFFILNSSKKHIMAKKSTSVLGVTRNRQSCFSLPYMYVLPDVLIWSHVLEFRAYSLGTLRIHGICLHSLVTDCLPWTACSLWLAQSCYDIWLQRDKDISYLTFLLLFLSCFIITVRSSKSFGVWSSRSTVNNVIIKIRWLEIMQLLRKLGQCRHISNRKLLLYSLYYCTTGVTEYHNFLFKCWHTHLFLWVDLLNEALFTNTPAQVSLEIVNIRPSVWMSWVWVLPSAGYFLPLLNIQLKSYWRGVKAQHRQTKTHSCYKMLLFNSWHDNKMNVG